MTSSNNPDIERKLQELEAQLNQEAASPQTAHNTSHSTDHPGNPDLSSHSFNINTEKSQSPQPNDSTSSLLENFDWERIITLVKNWFNQLPQIGKILVVLVAAFAGLSLLTSVLRLVSALITLAIVGVIVYLVYKVFFSSSTE